MHEKAPFFVCVVRIPCSLEPKRVLKWIPTHILLLLARWGIYVVSIISCPPRIETTQATRLVVPLEMTVARPFLAAEMLQHLMSLPLPQLAELDRP